VRESTRDKERFVVGQIITKGEWTRVTAEGINLKDLHTNYIKWGVPADDPFGGQSGYEFVSLSAHAQLDGTPCRLGKFIHHNQVVVMTGEVQFWADLKIDVYFADDDITHTFTAQFRHHETVNSPGYQDDIVKLPKVYEPDFVHVDGVEHRVAITGFALGGITVPEFHSPEGKSNEAYIVAKFEPASSPGG
jgi:hypothetical protein